MPVTLYYIISYIAVFILLLPEFLTLQLLVKTKFSSQPRVLSDSTCCSVKSLDIIVPVKVPEDEFFVSDWVNDFGGLFPDEGSHLTIASNGTWKKPITADDSRISVSHSSGEGSKAANIERALSSTSGEIVAVFDVDSQPAETVDLDYVTRRLVTADCLQGANIVSSVETGLIGELCEYGSLLSACTSESFSSQRKQTSQFRGTNGYFRREVAEILRFDVDTALEDIDSTIRMLLDGRTVAYDPSLLAFEAPPKDLLQLIRQRVRWNLGWGDLARKYVIATLRTEGFPAYQKLRVAGYLIWISFLLPGSIVVTLIGGQVLIGVTLIFVTKLATSEILLRKHANCWKMSGVFLATSRTNRAPLPRRILLLAGLTCLEFFKCFALIGLFWGTSSSWSATGKSGKKDRKHS